MTAPTATWPSWADREIFSSHGHLEVVSSG